MPGIEGEDLGKRVGIEHVLQLSGGLGPVCDQRGSSRWKSPGGARQVGPLRLLPSHSHCRDGGRQQDLGLVHLLPFREGARLGRTLTRWRTEVLGYFPTEGTSNGGAEAINGLIELHRRTACGFRNLDNYRLRMLLIGVGLDRSPHTHR